MARSSLYGDLLQGMKLPNWVFGGEFGDIENDIIKTEFARRQSDARALLNDAQQLENEQKQRNQDFQDQLGDIFKEKQPATVRDMYQIAMEQALGAGRSKDYMEVRQGLEELDKREKQQKIQDINAAIAAGRINPEYAGQIMPGLFTPDAVKRQQERNNLMGGLIYDPESGDLMPKPRASGGRSGGSRQPIAYRKGEDIQWVDPLDIDTRTTLAKAGYTRGEEQSDMDRLESEMGGAPLSKESDGFTLFKRQPTPTPTAAPQTMMTPPPGAVVRVIRRRGQ